MKVSFRSCTINTKNKYLFVNVLKMFENAVSEHRWNDVRLLAPIIVTMVENYSLTFVWNAVHMCMISLQVPCHIQMKILFLFFSSNIKNYEPALCFIAESFLDLNQKQFESIFERIHTTFNRKQTSSTSNICQAFQALYFYVQWKQKCCDSLNDNERSMNHDEEHQMSVLEQNYQQGQRILQMLETAFHLFHKRETDEDYDEQCEWILGPLLDTKVLLKKMAMTESGSDDTAGEHELVLLREYVVSNPDHLPAWHLYYNYVTLHHAKKSIKREILQKIISLCPQSPLLMNYIELLFKGKIKKGDSEKPIEASGSSCDSLSDCCPLREQDLDRLFYCFKLVIQSVEFESRQDDVRAWQFLAAVLRSFQKSWLNCWSCEKCLKSRKFIKEGCSSLYLWPRLFWNSQWLKKMAHKPNILVHSSYTAFMFGYDNTVISSTIKFLRGFNQMTLAMQLHALTTSKGVYSSNFNDYLEELKTRSRTPFQSTSISATNETPEIEVIPVTSFTAVRSTNKYS